MCLVSRTWQCSVACEPVCCVAMCDWDQVSGRVRMRQCFDRALSLTLSLWCGIGVPVVWVCLMDPNCVPGCLWVYLLCHWVHESAPECLGPCPQDQVLVWMVSCQWWVRCAGQRCAFQQCQIGGGTLSNQRGVEEGPSEHWFRSLPGVSDPPSCWVSSRLSISDFGSPGPPPSPVTRRSARHSGLRGYWLAPTPDLRLPSQFPALPLTGSVPLPLCGSFLIGAFLSISQVSSISLSLSVSVSPPWFLSVFLSPSTALSASLHLCLFPISVSPFL